MYKFSWRTIRCMSNYISIVNHSYIGATYCINYFVTIVIICVTRIYSEGFIIT